MIIYVINCFKIKFHIIPIGLILGMLGDFWIIFLWAVDFFCSELTFTIRVSNSLDPDLD